MTIASWLVRVDPAEIEGARRELVRIPGIEVRGVAGGRLVVLSEAAGPLEDVDAALHRVPGVSDVALAAAFDAEGGECP